VKKKNVKHGTNIKKTDQDRYPQKVFADRLITVDDVCSLSDNS
jgi:hypothetical protein